MNKQELMDALAAKTGDSKVVTGDTIDALIGTITAAVTKGDTVQLIGFGSFSTDARAARVGRNPATPSIALLRCEHFNVTTPPQGRSEQ